jgi:hypothetical protein
VAPIAAINLNDTIDSLQYTGSQCGKYTKHKLVKSPLSPSLVPDASVGAGAAAAGCLLSFFFAPSAAVTMAAVAAAAATAPVGVAGPAAGDAN